MWQHLDLLTAASLIPACSCGCPGHYHSLPFPQGQPTGPGRCAILPPPRIHTRLLHRVTCDINLHAVPRPGTDARLALPSPKNIDIEQPNSEPPHLLPHPLPHYSTSPLCTYILSSTRPPPAMPVAHIGLTVTHLPTSTSFFLSALQPLGYRYIGESGHQIGLGIHNADFFLCQETPGYEPQFISPCLSSTPQLTP